MSPSHCPNNFPATSSAAAAAVVAAAAATAAAICALVGKSLICCCAAVTHSAVRALVARTMCPHCNWLFRATDIRLLATEVPVLAAGSPHAAATGCVRTGLINAVTADDVDTALLMGFRVSLSGNNNTIIISGVKRRSGLTSRRCPPRRSYAFNIHVGPTGGGLLRRPRTTERKRWNRSWYVSASTSDGLITYSIVDFHNEVSGPHIHMQCALRCNGCDIICPELYSGRSRWTDASEADYCYALLLRCLNWTHAQHFILVTTDADKTPYGNNSCGWPMREKILESFRLELPMHRPQGTLLGCVEWPWSWGTGTIRKVPMTLRLLTWAL